MFLTVLYAVLLFQVIPLYLLYGIFAAVMNFKRARDLGTLSKTALVLGYPWYVVGSLLDVYCNLFVLSFWLLEAPKLWTGELTVTARVTRLKRVGGWRGDFARWFCDDLLDDLDPSGNHCS